MANFLNNSKLKWGIRNTFHVFNHRETKELKILSRRFVKEEYSKASYASIFIDIEFVMLTSTFKKKWIFAIHFWELTYFIILYKNAVYVESISECLHHNNIQDWYSKITKFNPVKKLFLNFFKISTIFSNIQGL